MTTAATREPKRTRLSPRGRRVLLTAHILVSVGLFGDVAGFLAVAIRAAGTDDPEVARASYDILAMFSTFFGIPLSLGALLTGIGLGLGTKWGVLRYPWTTAKLILILTVILMGAFILGPSVEQMRDGSGEAEGRILLGAIWDLVALGTATVLSVFKPGKARRGSRSRDSGPWFDVRTEEIANAPEERPGLTPRTPRPWSISGPGHR